MPSPSWIGQTIGGRYKVEAFIGRGGMADVYRATDPNLRRTVAVKLIHSHLAEDPEFVRRFEEEAAGVAQLRHPNIIQVFDFNHDGDTYYMVLEFVQGETLRAKLQALNAANQRMPLADILRISATVCDAVHYAHERGLIHRDLKPANVMLNPQGQPILMDFGVAKIVGSQHHTATGAVIGTPSYISPEQVRGERPDSRADIYSLGVMLFEMVAGRPPFDADTALGVMMKHANDPPPDIRTLSANVPDALARLIEEALAKDREERIQSADAMSTALRTVSLPAPEPPRPPAAKPDPAQPAAKPAPAQPADRPERTAVQSPQRTAMTPAPQTSLGRTSPMEAPARRAPAGLRPEAPARAPAKRNLMPVYVGCGVLGAIAVVAVVIGGALGASGLFGGGASPVATNTPSGMAVVGITQTIAPAAPATDTPAPTEAPEIPTPTATTEPTPIPVPEGMVLIPAGFFRMGSASGPGVERPEHPTLLPAYFMDLHEVTNARYRQCVQAGVCSPSRSGRGTNPSFDQHPVVGVTWNDAKTYCAWAGKRLPTEAEWEYAASGPENFIWPWGNVFDAQLSAASAPDVRPVGSYPGGASPFGLFDMAGNVAEWVADGFDADFYAASPASSPFNDAESANRIYRGGSYGNADGAFYTTSRRFISTRGPAFNDVDIGFRCAQEAAEVNASIPAAEREALVAQFCAAFDAYKPGAPCP